ncbi:WD repeat-containing protein 19, partial [Stegodyphus mimosarum]
MVARFFQSYNDNPSAIKFLVLSYCKSEALVLAQETHNMDVFAEAIGENGDPEDYINIAVYYEDKQNLLLAGKYCILAHRYKKAIKLLLEVSGQDEDESIKLAIEAAGRARDEHLTRQLINHIMGETDGAVKDLRHLYNLYLTLGQIKEAARTAVIMASAEQNSGTYKNARLLLLGMYQKLKEQGMKIPAEMSNSLMLLHSYSLGKLHMLRGDHMKSARMLIRVCDNINRFPRHDVQILTTAVFECQKAGLHKSAYKTAVILMRPKHRSKIEAKYKKKIETIVRKSLKAQDVEEAKTPCPYCGENLLQTSLYCEHCRYNVPYCIITGNHIISGDLTLCPQCHFPALFSEFSKSLSVDKTCPMCLAEVSVDELKQVEYIPPENFDDELPSNSQGKVN